MRRAEAVPVRLGHGRRAGQRRCRRGAQRDVQQGPGQVVQGGSHDVRVLRHLADLGQGPQVLAGLGIGGHFQHEAVGHRAGRPDGPGRLERVQQRAHVAGRSRVIQAREGDLLVAALVAAEVHRCLRSGLGEQAERQVQQADREAEIGDGVDLELSEARAEPGDQQELGGLQGGLGVEHDIGAVETDHPTVGPPLQAPVHDRVVHDVSEPRGGVAGSAGRGGAGDQPFGRPLGGGVHIRRVRPQRLACRGAHHLRDTGLGRRLHDVPGAENVRGHRAVHLGLGESRAALGSDMEHHVRPDLTHDCRHGRAVTDVGVPVLRALDPGPPTGDATAEADQAGWTSFGDVRHEHRADAPGAAGHHHRGVAQPVIQALLRQAQATLPDRHETGVLLRGAGLGGHESSGQIAQAPHRSGVQFLPSRRHGSPHRSDDLRDGPHPRPPA